ncbi:MAG: DUF1150 family protein [Pseudomonadota bacterium]
MTNKTIRLFGSSVEFESFGNSSIAYIRPVTSRFMNENYPDATEDDLPDGLDLWGLFAADGKPLAVADDEHFLISDAQDRDLLAVKTQ